MLKLEHLKYFQTAAESGRFSAAADILNVSASSIGYAVDNLERRLNTTLFIRKPATGITLTRDGRSLLGKCKSILVEAQSIEDSFLARHDKIMGTLVVGAQEGITWSLLPRAIKLLTKQHPGLKVIMKTVWMDDKFSALDSGEIDVLVTFLLDEQAPNHFASTLLCKPIACAMMRKKHPLDNGGQPISLKKIAKYPQIMINDGPAFALLYGMYESINLSPSIAMYCNISTSAQSAVGQSDSISLRLLRPSHNLSPLGDEITFSQISEDVRRPDLVAVTHKTKMRAVQSKQNVFIQACEELFRSGEMKKHIYY